MLGVTTNLDATTDSTIDSTNDSTMDSTIDSDALASDGASDAASDTPDTSIASDSGVTDTGVLDTGVTDSSVTDSGVLDSGSSDAVAPSDAAADTGASDSGAADRRLDATDACSTGSCGHPSCATALDCPVATSPVTHVSCCDDKLISGGTFPMGRGSTSDACPASTSCSAEEQPEHDVTVGNFYLDTFEVTIVGPQLLQRRSLHARGGIGRGADRRRLAVDVEHEPRFDAGHAQGARELPGFGTWTDIAGANENTRSLR